ncbi:TIGR02444 family protein [Pseudorhodoferax sp.]|uniref:TIGR02444 family protein n=1 Tax=Pseudorhodoferax sp. TaxID=1993553 RepID=UPI002DD65795|nr:TIGR02444 family protein [Pseudorhodoferax sp.]
MTEVPGTHTPDGLWAFSLAVYARPNVAPACLLLQDQLGLDVNLLLFCLYAGSRGRVLSVDECRRVDDAVRPWREHTVQPLRAVRRWLKTADMASEPGTAALRRRVQAIELDAERLQQAVIEAVLPLPPGRASAAVSAGNLHNYLASAGCHADEPQLQALARLWLGAHLDRSAADFVQPGTHHLPHPSAA